MEQMSIKLDTGMGMVMMTYDMYTFVLVQLDDLHGAALEVLRSRSSVNS